MSAAPLSTALFDRYADAIRQLPGEGLNVWEHDELAIDKWSTRGQRMAVAYAPFDHVTDGARIALVGITPGRYQATIALRIAQDGLRLGKRTTDILADAKRAASFAGPTRTNLVAMLDAIEIPAHLSLPSATHLFGNAADLVHCTSVLRYPVGRNEANYTGSTPPILECAALRSMIDTELAVELDQIPDALVIPLGVQATRAVGYLCATQRLDRARILAGFPHPSGANGSRNETLRRNRSILTRQARLWLGPRNLD